MRSPGIVPPNAGAVLRAWAFGANPFFFFSVSPLAIVKYYRGTIYPAKAGAAMIVTTADVIPGQAVQVLGLVRGNIVTSKNIGRDLMAGMKSIVGGEIVSYTQMTDEARQVAEDRMVAAAQNLGADAVVAMRFASDSIAEGTIEILAYGTAVKFA